MKAKTKIDKIERGVAGPVLGDVFAWGAAEGLRVLPGQLAAYATESGLDPRHLPREVDREAAARRAVTEAAAFAKVATKTIVTNPGAIVWAAVDSTIPDTAQIGDAVGVLTNRILYRKIEGDLSVEHDSPLAEDVLRRFTALVGTVGWRAIRDAVVHYLADWSAVRLWGTGAQYFVPKEHALELRQLRRFLHLLGAEAGCIPIPDCDDAREAVGVAVRRQVCDEIDRLRVEVDRWREGDGSPRASTLEARIASYAKLREELSAFSAALSVGVKDLEADLGELIRDASDLLAGGCAPEAAGPAPPVGGVIVETAPAPPPRPVVPPPADDLGGLSDRELRKLAKDRGLEARGLGRSELLGILAP